MQHITVKSLLLAFLALISGFSAWAVDSEYVGDKECYLCHKFLKEDYLKSSHGKIFTLAPRSELEALGCEACHGKGAKHSEYAGAEDYTGPLLIEDFKVTPESVTQTNQQCRVCHQAGDILHWMGSQHELNGLACTSCHKVHTKNTKVSQRVCETCHVEQRAKMQRSSHTPVREGLMTCMSCHNPHGSSSTGSLVAPSLNETCYLCHAERRGPFIWEHAPVRENCANCHDPHGSNQRTMLKMRPPYLCQTCHQAIFHPSDLYAGDQLASGQAPDKHFLGRSCLNCHSMVHGSNHPAGARLQR